MVNGQVAIKSYNILHINFLSTNNCFINTLQLFFIMFYAMKHQCVMTKQDRVLFKHKTMKITRSVYQYLSEQFLPTSPLREPPLGGIKFSVALAVYQL